MVVANPVLEVVVRVAMDASGATRGRVMEIPTGPAERPPVLVALGGDVRWRATISDPRELALVAYVAASGQAQALSNPEAALCVPCLHGDQALGALHLAGRSRQGGFTFDDIELASLFARVAGAALVARRGPSPPAPERLTAELRRLENADPEGYAIVTRLILNLMYA